MAVLVLAALPLACAVATEPEFSDPESYGGSGGAPTAGTAGSGVVPKAGSGNAFGGSASNGGSTSQGGKAGSTSSAGRASGGVAGVSQGGAGGSSAGAGGKASGGTGGSGSNGCQGLTAWVGGDPNLQIEAGEVVSWKGKRYKATAAIAYPNTECAPDAPADWCKGWFTPDGDC